MVIVYFIVRYSYLTFELDTVNLLRSLFWVGKMIICETLDNFLLLK